MLSPREKVVSWPHDVSVKELERERDELLTENKALKMEVERGIIDNEELATVNLGKY